MPAQPAPHLPVPKLPPTPAPPDLPSHAPPTRWPTSPSPCPSESVKSDLRQEMDVHARLAAAEAVQHVGGRGAAITHTEHCEFVLFGGDVRWAPVRSVARFWLVGMPPGVRPMLAPGNAPGVRTPADMSGIHPARPNCAHLPRLRSHILATRTADISMHLPLPGGPAGYESACMVRMSGGAQLHACRPVCGR